MRARSNAGLCGFVLLLALPSVLVASSASASVAGTSGAAPPTPAATWTPELMAKMLEVIAVKGVDRELTALAANALGLTASGQTWASRSVTWKEDNGKLHGFYISRGAEPDLVMTMIVPGTAYYYRVRRDGTATAAFTLDVQTRQITMRAPAEAQKSLDAELALWSDVVAGCVADRSCMPADVARPHPDHAH